MQTTTENVRVEKTSHKILVVEDDPTIRQLMTYGVSRAGYTVLAAEDGEEATSLIDDFKPNLILLDLYMPKMDGLSFLDQFGSRDIPIIVISGSKIEGHRDETIRRGASAFLDKPVSIELLLKKVDELLKA